MPEYVKSCDEGPLILDVKTHEARCPDLVNVHVVDMVWGRSTYLFEIVLDVLVLDARLVPQATPVQTTNRGDAGRQSPRHRSWRRWLGGTVRASHDGA